VVTASERYSCAYFHGTSLDFPVNRRLPLAPRFAAAVAASQYHREARFMAKRDETAEGVGDMASNHVPATYGEQLWNYFSRAYPTIVDGFYGGPHMPEQQQQQQQQQQQEQKQQQQQQAKAAGPSIVVNGRARL
jgi:hypothetical protein